MKKMKTKTMSTLAEGKSVKRLVVADLVRGPTFHDIALPLNHC